MSETWEEAGDGRWRRGQGWLIREDDRMAEAHIDGGVDTVHVYAPTPEGSPEAMMYQPLGSPLDGFSAVRSVQVEGLSDMSQDEIWDTLAATLAGT